MTYSLEVSGPIKIQIIITNVQNIEVMQKVKISKVCKISNGFAFKSDKYVGSNGARIIRITNVQKGRIVDNDPKLYPFSEVKNLDNYKINEGDIMMSLTGNVGRVGKFPKEFLPAYINQRVCRIMPKTDELDTNYLFHFLNSDIFENDAVRNSAGAAQLNLSTNWLSEYEIPLPPLPTQQKIANILDKADELRQYNKQLIEKYEALTQSLFLDMFGDLKSNSKKWDLQPFEYFVKFDTRMTSDFAKYASYPHIGIANIEKETGKLVDYKLISEENLSSGKYIFDETHIIYSKIRPNLNKVALPNFSGLCSADSYPLKVVKENANRIFLAYVLRSDSFVDFILTHSTRTNIPKANKEQMRKYIGIAPPIELQNQFAERVAIIEAQKQQAQLALAKSEALFQGLLQQAFNGELN